MDAVSKEGNDFVLPQDYIQAYPCFPIRFNCIKLAQTSAFALLYPNRRNNGTGTRLPFAIIKVPMHVIQ